MSCVHNAAAGQDMKIKVSGGWLHRMPSLWVVACYGAVEDH